MFSLYLKIAFRNLRRHKGYSAINIFGFVTGIAACLLILLFIIDETRFDRFNKNYQTIYRVAQEQNQDGTWYKVARSPAPLAAALKQDIPEITNSTVLALPGNMLLKHEDKLIEETGGMYAEKNLFQMFDFPFVAGSCNTAFANPNSIILTQKLAHKYFGESNALGRHIQINNSQTLTVTGIVKDVPAHSHLQFNFVIPVQFMAKNGMNIKEWGPNAFYTYVQLSEQAEFARVNAKIRNYFKAKLAREEEVLYLQALKDIHLYSEFDFNSDFGNRGDIKYVRFFSLIAGIVMLIACFNFMNLSTARATQRAKEVGLRKVIGARKTQLVFQFLSESVLLAVLAGALALLVVSLALPFFNELTGKQISLSHFDLTYIVPFGSLILFIGVFAGIYPAFFLSSFLPVKVLKGEPLATGRGAGLRKVLVTGQFTLSLIMIIGTLLINKQLQFIQDKKLGFNKDNLVYIEMRGQLKSNYATVKTELLRHPAIQAVSGTGYYSMPFKEVGSSGSGGFHFPGKNPKDHFMIHDFAVAPDFIQTLKLELKEGRSYDINITTDTANFLLNEAAVARMNLKNPVGQRISFYNKKGTVIGIVKDFHFTSLQQKIEPALIQIKPRDIAYLLVRINSSEMATALATIKHVVKKYASDYPFDYHFLDSTYEQLYKGEQKTSTLFNWFAFLAILVSGLGLFGLVSFVNAGRTKEIGVRKVLGASVSNILLLLSKDFMKLLLLAALLAWPVAYMGIKQWLQNYAFQININPWFFALPSIAVVLFALIVISLQTWQAANADPAKVLRNE